MPASLIEECCKVLTLCLRTFPKNAQICSLTLDTFFSLISPNAEKEKEETEIEKMEESNEKKWKGIIFLIALLFLSFHRSN